MKEKRLYRVNEGKILCGVCMGLSEYFEIDVTIVRLIWVFISLVYGSGLLLYIIAALIMPIKPPIKKSKLKRKVCEKSGNSLFFVIKLF